MNHHDIAVLCKALGDGTRSQIAQVLSGGEKRACELLKKFEIAQPMLSHHMRLFCECGLVRTRKEGKWSHSSLLAEFRRFIGALSCRDERCERCAR